MHQPRDLTQVAPLLRSPVLRANRRAHVIRPLRRQLAASHILPATATRRAGVGRSTAPHQQLASSGVLLILCCSAATSVARRCPCSSSSVLAACRWVGQACKRGRCGVSPLHLSGCRRPGLRYSFACCDAAVTSTFVAQAVRCCRPSVLAETRMSHAHLSWARARSLQIPYLRSVTLCFVLKKTLPRPALTLCCRYAGRPLMPPHVASESGTRLCLKYVSCPTAACRVLLCACLKLCLHSSVQRW